VSNWSVTLLELSRVIQNLDIDGESLRSLQGVVRFEDHDISDLRHVILVQTLDGHTNVETTFSDRDRLMVHLDGEDTSSTWERFSVGWEENNFLSRLDDSLFDLSGDNVTDSLDVVDTVDWKTERLVVSTDGGLSELVEGIVKGDDLDGLSILGLDVNSGPPWHVIGLGEKIVSSPSRDWDNRDRGHDEVLLPSDTDQDVSDFITDFIVSRLGPVGEIRIHLVDADDQLLDSEQVKETSVFTGLSFDFSGLGVSLSKGSSEVTISRDHQDSNISLGSSRNHVLHEITMSRSIDDGVMVLWSVEILQGTHDGNTTSTFFLGLIHEESKAERVLSEGLGFSLQLGHITFVDTSELIKEMTSGGGFTRVDMSADDD